MLTMQQRAKAIAYNPGDFGHRDWEWAHDFFVGEVACQQNQANKEDADILVRNLANWRSEQTW